MNAQLEKSKPCNSTSLIKMFSVGSGLGFIATLLVANVAVGMMLGISLTFLMGIVAKRCEGEVA